MQAQSAGLVLEGDVDEGAERLAQVDGAPVALVAQPGRGGGLRVEVVGARHAPGPALAHVQAGRVGQVGEVADPVGVELGGELGATAAEQQPAPEGVLDVPPAEGLQLDRLERQEQRLLRLRAAQHRRLNTALVTRQ
ncbi:hypothetical protein ACIRS1_25450 [Kitasatospora sp. NPDC101176]|uniref:hypothetical protein n=1 Tax=Kitasatospora sp. NPDC101176 TaxID=3364099 RepID=UPI00381E3CAE